MVDKGKFYVFGSSTLLTVWFKGNLPNFFDGLELYSY